MTTIINNPKESTETSDSVLLTIVLVIVLLVGAILLFNFIVLPAIQSSRVQQEDETIDVNVEVPKDIFDSNSQPNQEGSSNDQ